MKGVLSFLLATLLMMVTGPLLADSVELTNGDVLNGQILSLDASEVRLKSEVHGDMTLPRSKVSAIHFGERKTARTAPLANPLPQLQPAQPGQLQTPEEVLKQLQTQGLDPGSMKSLQQQFPLLNSPEAQGYFNEMLGGLMTGKKDMNDLRKDAIYARDQLKDLQEELGENGAALNGYMSILNRFIEQTEPKSPQTPEQPATGDQP